MLSTKRHSVHDKIVLAAVVCAVVLGGTCLSGCLAQAKSEGPKSRIKGTIVVSSPEEQEAADAAVETLFAALEAGDEQAIKEMFSDYALENAPEIDENIEKLISYFPGADGGYDGVGVSTENKDQGKYQHVLDLILTVRNGDDTYKIGICLQMKNEFDPTREGVHLIEVIREEEMQSDFFWKESNDHPGIYVWG